MDRKINALIRTGFLILFLIYTQKSFREYLDQTYIATVQENMTDKFRKLHSKLQIKESA